MKAEILKQAIEHLTKELTTLKAAAQAAHLAAIDDQSVAETQYDTLAIEASYLAEGQSKRVDALEQAILSIKELPVDDTIDESPIRLGCLVTIEEKQLEKLFFVAPAAAGFIAKVNNRKVTFVTPQSPLGAELIGSSVGDEVIVKLANSNIDLEIIAIC